MTLPLDPKPWLHKERTSWVDYRGRTQWREIPVRSVDGGIDNAIWRPRPGYEQNVEKYQ